MKRITLKKKLVSGFLGVALITILVGYAALIGMEQTGEVLTEISSEHLPSLISLAKINRDLNEIRILEQGMVMEDVPDLRQKYVLQLNQYWHVLEADWKNYTVLRKTPKEAQLWQELVSERESWRKLDQEVARLVSKGDEPSLKLARNLVHSEGKDRFDQCHTRLLALYDLNERSMIFFQKKSVATLNLSKRLALTSALIGVCLSTGLGVVGEPVHPGCP